MDVCSHNDGHNEEWNNTGATKVGEITRKVRRSRLKWYGHVMRSQEEYLGKRVLLFFRLFPSGVATADYPSPVLPFFCIPLRHFNLSYVLFHFVHKPPFWLSLFHLSWQLHPQHPSPNIYSIFPSCISMPPRSCLSNSSHLCCPYDILIPDLFHSCHS